jgi:MFS family permease
VSTSVAWILLPAALVLLAAFAYVERRVQEPILPLGLLLRRLILVSSIAGALVGAVMIAAVTYLPFYVQEVLGGTPTEAGGAVAPMLVGWPLAGAIGGRLLTRIGYRPLVRAGFALVLLSAVLIVVLLKPDVSPVPIGLSMALMGVGLGLANTALVIAVQESVPWQERGVATASTMFFRTIGGAIAVAGLGALLVAGLRDKVDPELLAKLAEHARGTPLDPEARAALAPHLDAGVALVFRVVVGLSVAAFAASLFFPNTAMKTARRADGAAAIGEE